MNTTTSTRIAAGVTAIYLRDVTRRPAPPTDPDVRRATARACGAPQNVDGAVLPFDLANRRGNPLR